MELLKKLCSFIAPSGSEGNIREFILSEIENYAEKCEIDALGNLIVSVKGKKRASKKLMIIAHMDEVGFIVTDITESGLIKFNTIGGFCEEVLCGKSVEFKNGIKGVVVPGVALHQTSENERKNAPSVDDLFIDIGALNKEDAEKHIGLGDKAAFEANFSENERCVISKALDDRIGVYILINLIKKGLMYDCVFVFSVQEEVGLRGAATAANRVSPDMAIIIDSTTASDLPDVSGSDRVCLLGNGGAVSFMDRATVYDEDFYKLIMKTAKKEEIPVQFKTRVAGGNDAGAVHKSGTGVVCAAVSTPCRYIHSAFSMAAKSDIKAIETLLEKVVSEILA
jgi:endoglucanase